jgi:hypothetical protein
MHNEMNYTPYGVGLVREGDFTYLTMEISNYVFENTIQFAYDTLDRDLTVPLRVAYSDDTGEVFLSTEFNLIVRGPEVVSPCAGVSVTQKNAPKANYAFAFNVTTDPSEYD